MIKRISITVIILACNINIHYAQWQQINNGFPGVNVRGITSNSQYLFCCEDNAGVFRSSNQGANWTAINNGIPTNGNWALRYVNSTLFVGNQFGAIYRSTDNGNTWVNIGLNGARNFIYHNNYLFTALWYSVGVSRSTNNGTNWVAVNPGLTGGNWPMLSNASFLFVGSQLGGVYRTSNNGDNWLQVNSGLTNSTIYALVEHNGAVYAAGTAGVFRSTNNGNNWSASNNGISSAVVYALHSVNNALIAGASSGIYLSYDNGNTWTLSLAGNFTEFHSDASYIYAGSLGEGIYRRLISQIQGISTISNQIPKEYSLSQNYPNPFNPVTNIEFSIPKNSNVRLILFDALGKEAMVLVNTNMQAGKYRYDFDASELSSGVYFYRLETELFTAVKKMILLK